MNRKLLILLAPTLAVIGCATNSEPRPIVGVEKFAASWNSFEGELSLTRGSGEDATRQAAQLCQPFNGLLSISLNDRSGRYAYKCRGYEKTAESGGARSAGDEAKATAADDALCLRYGFLAQTAAYAECRMKLDTARREARAQRELYDRQQLEYLDRLEAAEKERRRIQALNQTELGLRLLGGQSPVDALNSVGTGAPIAPRPPAPVFHNITLPNGSMVTCTTNGTFTNCN